MKNTFGNNITVTIFGESHGPAIGAVIDGMPPGIKIDSGFIKKQLDKRKPKGKISTARVESDRVQIISGVFEDYSCGTPICLLIQNQNQHSKDYSKTKALARPSHADYSGDCKYLGFQDYRGGGHFSGRLTTPLVAVGAICLDMLASKGIYVASHLKSIKDIEDVSFSSDEELLKQQMDKVNDEYFATIDDAVKEPMNRVIEDAFHSLDSVGGTIETAIINMPAGVGEPYFDSVESILSHALYSVGAIKGVQFGTGFPISRMYGSEANDSFRMKDGKVITSTNHNGGINGGITNGMPIIITTAIKPTPSIYQKQDTINFRERSDEEICIEGRHDPCIAHRARVVIDSVVAIGLVDLLLTRYGQLYFQSEPKENF